MKFGCTDIIFTQEMRLKNNKDLRLERVNPIPIVRLML